MQTRLFITIVLIVAISLCAVHVRAQQTNSTAENKQAADAALREKAYVLLKSLAGELGTLQSAENRARIGSNIGGSLWPHDESRARELFAQVQQDINLGLKVPENMRPEDANTLMVFMRLRADTIERIGRHDPELAYSFFKATGFTSEKELPDYIRESERGMESHIAKQLASSSPNLSLELARRMLERDYSDDLRFLLSRLNKKHKEQATVLYKEIVRKLGDTDLTEHWNARNFALNLANSFAPPAVDESMFRELVNLFVKPMVENGCTRKLADEDERINICRMFAPAIPLMTKVDPSRASRLQHWANQSDYYSPPSPYYELHDVSQNGTVDDMLALIEQYPRMESDIRFQAMQKAVQEGDLDRARRIVTEFNGEPERQRLMLEEIDRRQARATINKEQLEEVQKQLSALQGPLEQTAYLVFIANQVGDKDRKAALKFLNQASEIVETIRTGKEQTGAQIVLAMAYSYFGSNRGLAIMESLMPKLNELISSAAKLDGYDTSYLRDGEWNMTAEGQLGSMLTWLAHNASYFAWFDFDRAVSVAGQFEKPEIRMMAQLKLAQGILAGRPKPLQLDYAGAQH